MPAPYARRYVDCLSDLDAMMERGVDRLPPLLLAKALVRLDGIGRGLARIRQAMANVLDDDRRAVPPGRTRQDAT
jgi:hypothetical protein